MLANSDVTGLGGPGMMEPMFPPEPPAAPEPAPMSYSPMMDEEFAPPKPKKDKDEDTGETPAPPTTTAPPPTTTEPPPPTTTEGR